MIISRRPIPIFDVDLVGAATIAAVVAAGWWLVLQPLQQTWSDYGAVALEHRTVQEALQGEIAALEEFRRRVTQYEEVVADHADAVPNAGTVSDLLQEITDLAEASNLEVFTVRPARGTRQGAFTVSDVEVGGRGSSRNFVRFLDELAQRNPYQTLMRCTIRRLPESEGDACDLRWTTRLYLLPDAESPLAASGGAS